MEVQVRVRHHKHQREGDAGADPAALHNGPCDALPPTRALVIRCDCLHAHLSELAQHEDDPRRITAATERNGRSRPELPHPVLIREAVRRAQQADAELVAELHPRAACSRRGR